MEHDILYYQTIQNALNSSSLKETQLRVAKRKATRDFARSLNWETALVDGVERQLQITSTAYQYLKDVRTRPDETITCGAIVEWRNAFWLVKSVDADAQVHNIAAMTQCSVILKWKRADGSVASQYATSEDATKYSVGLEETQYMQIGKFALKVCVQANEDTLCIARDKRFLIGQYGDGYRPSSFIVTRINQVTGSYELTNETRGTGYIEITLIEDQFKEGVDNAELGIADYFAPSGGTESGTEDETRWF